MTTHKQKNYLTSEALAEYQAKLKRLQEVDRPQVIEEIKEARNQGDLSENAEYDAARDKQAMIENQITEIQAILDNYELIETSDSNHVRIGSIVSFKNLSTQTTQTVTIVGALEADPFSEKISNLSPLAQALLDKKVGSVVEVEGPHKYNIEILDIKRI
ncbi:transcription elongation factor GreA [Metamycoplasma subdolum]|uniref:Transcription elongation factor GreA n=1 Tax=Metamycoplasma subdolum TaxID=92407 RepID=A0A3M0AIZ7_9BACT|nr:transcription elongation factor GreA [Metamycoplasma subdolum]RMA79082.1 transcription elongation factor GreA [Metamycoplasma subdolum]WPB50605.1 transcription elongation factor GreA [Metamycoplasma subdolum]